MGLFDIFNSSNTSNLKSDGGLLFSTAFGGITELEKTYKNLSDEGKFEVLIFNGLSILRSFHHYWVKLKNMILISVLKN